MILVDTSAWIEWLIASPTGDLLTQHLPKQTDWLVPTMVQLELSKWLTREVGEEKADQVIAYTQVCRVVSLETDVALLTAEFCRLHKLATADAVIYATAQLNSAKLLTCDAHFEGLPDVRFVEKSVS